MNTGRELEKAPKHGAIAAIVAVTLCFVPAGCGSGTEPAPVVEASPDATGSLIVRGGAETHYAVLDGTGRQLDKKWTNTPVELLPGDYTVEVRGTRLQASVEPGRETLAAETGDLFVPGDGQARYTIFDDARHKLDEK